LAVKTEHSGAVVGYRQASSREVQAVDHCWVLDGRLDALLPDLRDLFRGQRGHGEVAVALGAAAKPVVELRWSGELAGSFFAALDARIEKGVYAGAEVWLDGARAPARFGDPRALTSAADGEPMWVPSGAFAQAHPTMSFELGERLLACAEPSGQAVVELFAGSGNFTVLFARHAASLVAVESDPRAVAAARANLAERGLTARVVEKDADNFQLPPGTRLVLLDPPRAGATGAVRQILRSRARRVVYVSCDVQTLARDVASLVACGFQLTNVEMFEMFPHTSHVEALVVLDRTRAGTSARIT
jgi:23S rRNA (uracil1939-C5)-methyltransferase